MGNRQDLPKGIKITDSFESQDEQSDVSVNKRKIHQEKQVGWLAVARMLLLVGFAHISSAYIFGIGSSPLLLLTAAILGWFAYCYVIEWVMLSRRAIAEVGTKQTGWLYRLLHNGSLSKVATGTICMFLSVSFLMHSNQMPSYLWFWIYMDVFIITALLHWLQPHIEAQGKPITFGIFGRKLTFIINLSVLSLLIIATSFFIPVEDLRDFGVWESFSMGWDSISSQGLHPLLTLWAAMIAGVDHATWNLMQQISQQSVAIAWKLLGWLGFFIIQSLYIVIIQAAMLGTMASAEKKGWADAMLGKSKAAKWGWGTFYLLIAIWLLLNLMFDLNQQERPSQGLLSSIQPPIHLATTPGKTITIDPCKNTAIQASSRSAAGVAIDGQIDQEKSSYIKSIDEKIDTQVNVAFTKAITGVNAYLDWYFTITGEWERLGGLLTGDVGKLMQDKMHETIINNSGFEVALLDARGGISKVAQESLSRASQQVLIVVKTQWEIQPCSTEQKINVVLPELSRDVQRLLLTSSTAVTAGVIVGKSIGAAVTTKLAASATSKLAAKLLAKAAAKTAIKTAGGLTAGAVGAMSGLTCGPLAWICSPALAAVGFIGIDALFVEGDEIINRDTMRNDMTVSLVNEREKVKLLMKEQYHRMGNTYFSQLAVKVHTPFVPIQDGMQ